MEDTEIKQEVAVKQEDRAILAGSKNDLHTDLYQDVRDLEIPDDVAANSWLLRVNRAMWLNWTKLEANDDEEIQLGVMRVKPSDEGTCIDFLLNSSLSANDDFPYEYEMDVTNHDTDNTFIFTESLETVAQVNAKRSRPSNEDAGPARFRGRRNQSKRTRLAACVKHELSCRELDTPRQRALLAKRAKKLAWDTTMLDEHSGGPRLAEGNLGTLKNFVRTNAPSKRRGQEDRAVRMSETELTRAIFDCFKEYQYWPIKALKARMHQPESYLKAELKKYAVLVKSGPFNGKWRLKDEWKATAQITDQVAEAPEPGTVMDDPSGTSGLEDVDFGDSMGESASDPEIGTIKSST